MLRGIALFVSLVSVPVFGANLQFLSALPNGAAANGLQLDSAGNIYMAGSFTPASQDKISAFVAKLSPDGSKLLYFTTLAGSFSDRATALALGPDGSAYVSGNTNSSDFPVTAGALQPNYIGGGQTQGFLTKVNSDGVIVYSTFINGIAATQITGMVIDKAGAVFLTGSGGPGYSFASGEAPQGFLVKLDAGMGKVLLSIDRSGGGLIALDNQGNIYLAGSAVPNVTNDPANNRGQVLTLPSLPPRAFQPTHDARFCFVLGSGPGGPGGAYPCHYQYISKLTATGTLLWATYVTGTYGATATGMAVDEAGNVIVAGTTNSDDYPVTPGAFQTSYAPAAPPFPVPPTSSFRSPPPSTGYLSKINATGTGLIWSTYFGGSYSDQITSLAVFPTGEILLSGQTLSSDLPVLTGTPDACRPSPTQVLGFVGRVASDGATAGLTQLVAGAPACLFLSCTSLLYDTIPIDVSGWPVALRPNGTALVAAKNGSVASVDFSSSSRIACIADPADNVQLRDVAPGQLLSLFGVDLAPAEPFIPAAGGAPSSDSFGIFFNGIPAPILFSSGQQINVQVPYELAGQTTVQMQIIDKQVPLPVSETRTLGVVEQQPAVFLSPLAFRSPFPGYTVCGTTMAIGEAAVALNADGTLNDCRNPAIAGSVITIFLDGLGPVTPALATGTLVSAPAVALTPDLELLDSNQSNLASSTKSVPGSISGVAQVQVQLPRVLPQAGPLALTPRLAGVSLRERLILVWTRPD